MTRIITPQRVHSEGHRMRFLSDDGTRELLDTAPILPADARCDAVCGVAVCVLPAGHGRERAASLVTP